MTRPTHRPKPGYATTATIAKDLGLDARTVARCCAAAGLSPVSGSPTTFVKADALRAVDDHLNVDKVTGHALGGRGDAQITPQHQYAQARAGTEALRTKKMQLDIDIRRGSFVSKVSIKQAGATIIERTKGQFKSMGVRVAPKLVGETDPLAIVAVVNEEVTRILTTLSDLALLAEDPLL